MFPVYLVFCKMKATNKTVQFTCKLNHKSKQNKVLGSAYTTCSFPLQKLHIHTTWYGTLQCSSNLYVVPDESMFSKQAIVGLVAWKNCPVNRRSQGQTPLYPLCPTVITSESDRGVTSEDTIYGCLYAVTQLTQNPVKVLSS